MSFNIHLKKKPNTLLFIKVTNWLAHIHSAFVFVFLSARRTLVCTREASGVLGTETKIPIDISRVKVLQELNL